MKPQPVTQPAKFEQAYCVFCDQVSAQQITVIYLLDETNAASEHDLRQCSSCCLSTIWKDGDIVFPPADEPAPRSM